MAAVDTIHSRRVFQQVCLNCMDAPMQLVLLLDRSHETSAWDFALEEQNTW